MRPPAPDRNRSRDGGRGPVGRFLEYVGRRHGPPTSFVRIPLPTPGRLFVSPMPFGPYDVRRRLFASYRRERVSAVLVLVTDDELKRKCKRDLLGLYALQGLRIFRLPFQDLTAPVARSLAELIPMLEQHLRGGGHLAVHCNAGVGRTSVVTACLVASAYGWSGERALAHLAPQMMVDLTDEQRRSVARFAPDAAGSGGRDS